MHIVYHLLLYIVVMVVCRRKWKKKMIEKSNGQIGRCLDVLYRNERAAEQSYRNFNYQISITIWHMEFPQKISPDQNITILIEIEPPEASVKVGNSLVFNGN